MVYPQLFDEQAVCVNIDPGAYAVNNGMVCDIDDKNDGEMPEGMAQAGCVYLGKPLAPSDIDASDLELAVISVRPQPELYSQLIANQDNGINVQLLNKGCNLSDIQGHPITKFVAGLPSSNCADADITIRYLEGDVNADCVVDAEDQQRLAFRWGAGIGSLLYNERYDLEPSGVIKGDGDIDIKDVQFVFGRHNSSCGAQNSAGTIGPEHPPQEPVNPKAP